LGQLGWLCWDINSIASRAIESAQPNGQAGHQVVLRVYLAAKPFIKEYTSMATMVASDQYKQKASLPTSGLVIELLNDRSNSFVFVFRWHVCHRRFLSPTRANAQSAQAVLCRIKAKKHTGSMHYAVSSVILTCNRLSAATVFIVLMVHYFGYFHSLSLQRWAATLNYATQPLSVSLAAPEFHIFCVALARS
jgi:hypothetical protein